MSIDIDPVYWLWGDNNVNPTRFVIYLAPDTYSGILEGHFIPQDLVNPTDIVTIPYEFIDLVVLGVMMRAYFKFQGQAGIREAIEKVAMERQNILNKFIEKRRAEEKELESFEEEVNPIFIVKKEK